MLKRVLRTLGSLLLCGALLLPATPLLAEDGQPFPEKHLLVDDNNYVYNGASGVWDETPPASVQYDPAREVLRLTNYTGGPIVSMGLNLTLELAGKNTIDGLDNSWACPLQVVSGGSNVPVSLHIRAVTPGASLRFIGSKITGGIFAEKDLTLESGSIYMDTAPRLNAGMEAWGKLSIGEKASLSIATVPIVGTSSTLPARALGAVGGITVQGGRSLREGESLAALTTVDTLSIESKYRPPYSPIPASAPCVVIEPVPEDAPPDVPEAPKEEAAEDTAGADEAGAVEDIRLNMAAKLLRPGQSVALKAEVLPAGGAVDWHSTNPAVASVSGGRVKALKKGSATITATAGGRAVSCRVRVDAKAAQRAVKAVKLDRRSASLRPGGRLALQASFAPAKPLNKGLVWASSDPGVATVNAKGLVRAKGKGRAVITATSAEGGKTARCTVRVG